MKVRGFLTTMLVFVLLIVLALVFASPVIARPGGTPLVPAFQAQAGQLTVNLTYEFIGMVAGAVLSLAFSYVPGLAPAYALLDDTWKRLIMLLLMGAVTAAVMGLGCAGIIGGIDCSQNGIVNAVLTFFFSAMANQTVHQLSPRVGLKAKPAALPGVTVYNTVQYPPAEDK